MYNLNYFACCILHIKQEFRASFHQSTKFPTNIDRQNNSMGHLLPCAIDFKTNHPPVYLQWIGIFGLGYLDTLRDHHLTQMQIEPSRKDRILYFVCTSKPSLIKCVSKTPGISDHLAVVCDSDIVPAYQKEDPCTVYIFSKANLGKMKEVAKLFASSFISQIDQFTVDENWTKLRTILHHQLNLMSLVRLPPGASTCPG